MKYFKKIGYALCLLMYFNSMANAQQVDSIKLTGVWKLVRSGFIEDGAEVLKDFDACRLSRNFVFNTNGAVDYTYYEGTVDTCYKAEVERYYWNLKGNILELESSGHFGYYEIEMCGQDEFIKRAVKQKSESTGDPFLDKMLNTVHFDVYRRQLKPVNCVDCKLVLKLD